MRYLLLLLPLLAACAKAEKAQPETAAAAGPMALTDADVAGTWTGTSMPMGSDSVLAHWTQVCGSGTCKGTVEGMTDTVPATYTLMADSVMGQSAAYTDPAVPGVRVMDMWTLHLQNGKVVGTGTLRLADNPDSVVMRYRFEGSRTTM
jgi:hypothetical protein